jgi:hypothetical protein
VGVISDTSGAGARGRKYVCKMRDFLVNGRCFFENNNNKLVFNNVLNSCCSAPRCDVQTGKCRGSNYQCVPEVAVMEQKKSSATFRQKRKRSEAAENTADDSDGDNGKQRQVKFKKPRANAKKSGAADNASIAVAASAHDAKIKEQRNESALPKLPPAPAVLVLVDMKTGRIERNPGGSLVEVKATPEPATPSSGVAPAGQGAAAASNSACTSTSSSSQEQEAGDGSGAPRKKKGKAAFVISDELIAAFCTAAYGQACEKRSCLRCSGYLMAVFTRLGEV